MAKSKFEGSLIPHAEEFHRQTLAHGGSTFHLASRSFVPVHGEHDPTQPDQFIVGKEPDTSTGSPIPTRTLNQRQFGRHEAHSHIVKSMIRTSGSKTASAGSWVNPRGDIDLDVSGSYANKTQAVAAGRRRGEEAIFATNPAREIFL